MSEQVQIRVNGVAMTVPGGITIAAALLNAEVNGFRRSVSGEMRGPLCGMGVCYECRATVNGRAHRKTCQIVVRDGLEVTTDEL
ncbi:MAG: (2Fe-2S)-binding protein [Burkholderiales bacterium]|nr:(2Fe-2S)-binding protein [Phycisphaerae bacterium]